MAPDAALRSAPFARTGAERSPCDPLVFIYRSF